MRPDRCGAHRVSAFGLAGLAGLAATAALLGGCSATPAPDGIARAYLAAWSRGDDAAAARLTDSPGPAGSMLAGFRRGLDVAALAATVTAVTTNGASAQATCRVDVTVGGLGRWTFNGRIQLRRNGSSWLVAWSAADIYPGLGAGDRLAVRRSLPTRASFLDDHGQPLFVPTPVVTVGIEPSRWTDPAAALPVLVATLGIDPAGVRSAVAAAAPDAFVPVITLRRSAYEKVRAVIHPLPGVVFQTGVELLAPTPTFARAVLGRVGPATAEALASAGPDFTATDQIGLSGLQQVFQSRLAGTPTGSVVVEDPAGHLLRTLDTVAGAPGQSVSSTLDLHLQAAAEQALAGVKLPAALVAVRPSDGAILAIANRPGDSALDLALVGTFPPGSTFKVVSSYALLSRGVTSQTPVACPAQVTVDGKRFTNFEGETAGSVPFATDFARSCNTAFVGLSARLGGADLTAAATAFGIGAGWRLPLPAFTGGLPAPADPLEVAADTIGQGRVLVSPVSMALVAAGVESGTWRPPLLVTDPASPPGVSPIALDPARVAELRALMTGVVTGGTAAQAGLPAGTAGKTGTAEFGSATPPQTHAWFIGYRGDLAVAVVVERGGIGGQVAAPIAARFLTAAGFAG